MKKKIRKFENHSITRRLYLLFSLICLLFLVLIARLGYMQIYHPTYYTDKLAKATKKTVKQGSVRGQIYDATGKPLVENVGKQVLTFTRDRKMTAQEMRETAGKLLQYVDVENPKVTERQEVDYYLANTTTCLTKRNLILMGIVCPKPRFIKQPWIVLTLQNLAIQMMKKRSSIFIVR